MQILCHGKIDITMKIYTEVPDVRTQDALGRLGDQLERLNTAALRCCTST